MDSRLPTFLTVARMKQLTRASQHLNLAASSVSQQIAGLERDVGATLFSRTSRGMTLTPPGRVLYAAAEEMEATWQKTLRSLRHSEDPVAEIRIAASHTVSELYLQRPLGRFRTEFPSTRIHLSMMNSAEVMDQVLRGIVDIGIIEGAAHSTRVERVVLWQDTMGLILSQHHPMAARHSIDIQELEQLEWILREAGSGTRRVFERALEDSGFTASRFTVLMELSSLRAITAMVANNVGVSVVSTAIVESHDVEIPKITVLPIRGLNLTRTIEAVVATDSKTSAVEGLLSQLEDDVAIRVQRRL